MKIIFIRKKDFYIIFIILFVLLVSFLFNRKRVITTSFVPINNIIIGVDPGHGGIDPGTVSKSGVREDRVNLSISLKLKRLLEQSGGIVVITRKDEKGLYTEESNTLKEKKSEDLKKRKEIIEKGNCDLLISIHLNSFSQSKYYGAQTFYKKDCEDSKMIAYTIQEELKKTLDKDNDRVPQERDDVFLIREVNIPAIIVECGFLSNPREEKLLSNEKYQEKVAWAIYLGIMRYFNQKQKS